jgi:hypothetical protein
MAEYVQYEFADFSGSLASTGTVAPLVLNKDGIQGVDCRHYGTILVQISGTFTATFGFQFSNDDGVTWSSALGSYVTATTTSISTSSSSTGIFVIPVVGKTFRLQCTAYTSGTIVCKGYKTASIPAYYNPGSTTVTPTGSATAGASIWHHNISAATTNATSVKASNASINNLIVSNNGAGVAYFKLYDKASAPTIGTDTPVATILIPINATVVIPGGTVGTRTGTGLAYGITGGMAVADTTAVAATQVSVAINYT